MAGRGGGREVGNKEAAKDVEALARDYVLLRFRIANWPTCHLLAKAGLACLAHKAPCHGPSYRASRAAVLPARPQGHERIEIQPRYLGER